MLYRWHLGWLMGRRFLLLEHQGRHSGRRYRTVLEVLKWDPAGEVFVLSGWGPASDWYRNVLAGGEIRITHGGRRFPASTRVVGGDEASSTLADYESRNRLVRPIVRAMLGYMAGLSYDGSVEARRRLVAQLPVIAFRPSR